MLLLLQPTHAATPPNSHADDARRRQRKAAKAETETPLALRALCGVVGARGAAASVAAAVAGAVCYRKQNIKNSQIKGTRKAGRKAASGLDDPQEPTVTASWPWPMGAA